MLKPDEILITEHARLKWSRLAQGLGLWPGETALRATFSRAVPEVPTNETTSFNLLRRSVLHGGGEYYVAEGWRFVLKDGFCVTVERVKPHENYIGETKTRSRRAA